MKERTGYACVRLNYSAFGDMSLIVGLSQEYPGEFFYYVSINYEITKGPFLFGYRTAVTEMMEENIKEKEKAKVLPERWDESEL
jgi:hypothetical protein